MNATKSETDWERVLAFKEGDAIPTSRRMALTTRMMLKQPAHRLRPGRPDPPWQGRAPRKARLRKKLRQRSWSRCASRPK